MSSNDESDDEFQSADEDIDFEPHFDKRLELKCDDSDDINAQNHNADKNIDQELPQLDPQLKVKSIYSSEEREDKKILCESKTELGQQTTLTKHNDTFSDKLIDESQENKIKAKTVIKGRKILRKADRLRDQTNTEELDICEQKKVEVLNKLSDLTTKSITTEESHKTYDTEEKKINSFISLKEEENIEKWSRYNIPSNQMLGPKEIDIKTEDIQRKTKVDNNQMDFKTEEYISEIPIETNEEKETIDDKTRIKGTTLLPKVDSPPNETIAEESEICEEKKIEILNKLSDLSANDDTASNWNNWFTDIKSAAMTATSTTVNHVSQASNKWSLNPKSFLTSAVSLTTNVGSGISSVVENVSSVVDSAIGAPPPEQMAAIVNKDSKVESNEQNTRINENQSKSGIGFGLFDYTLNTLESIGKKTMEVIVDDKHKRDIKTDKTD